jgi:hypothetical protein
MAKFQAVLFRFIISFRAASISVTISLTSNQEIRLKISIYFLPILISKSAENENLEAWNHVLAGKLARNIYGMFVV